MIFNSLTFLLLLAVVVVLYWMLPTRPRLSLIFAASLTFYGFWRVEFVPVMLLSVVVDYVVSIRMAACSGKESSKQKKRLLWISLVVNLGLLFYFKYLVFFADNAVGLANLFGGELDPITLNIILPLGISFYTFQTISYTVDVYRGTIEPERDFLLYACYVVFFPQLVAGPILRAAEVIHQLAERPAFQWLNIAVGLRRITYGMFLKVVLADNIAPIVDDGYAMATGTMSALDVWTLAFLFGFQIYFDFSAYSHIAIGSARLMGIQFPENFHFPYLATSPRDFWRRWHISLSSWIRDYLYLPLAGTRPSAGVKFQDRSTGGLSKATDQRSHNLAMFATWAIMGLWHGANWTFVIWGLYHAVMVMGYRLVGPWTRKLPTWAREVGGVAVTLPLMMLAWIPFRADSLHDSVEMWWKIIDPSAYGFLGMRENVYLVAAIVSLGIFIAFMTTTVIRPRMARFKLVWLVSETLMFSVVIPLVVVFFRPISQFIYFQF